VTLIEQLARIHRNAERLVRRRIASRTDRPFLQLRALRVIRSGEIHTQAALAERLTIDAPATSRLVDRLVDDGLVSRRPGADRRCICLDVTPAGAAEIAVLDEAVAWVEKEVRRLLGKEDAKEIAPMLDKVVEGLSAAAPDED
jgi:DNA-binding MarR family transcriptional regulator